MDVMPGFGRAFLPEEASFFERGFLPKEDPHIHLPAKFRLIENAASRIPELRKAGNIREVFETLPEYTEEDFRGLSDMELHAVMRDVSHIVSAYYQFKDPPPSVIPRNLACTIFTLAKMLGVPPILAYQFYQAHNWKRKDPHKGIELDNLELITRFGDVCDGDWFILVHTPIEARGGRGLVLMPTAQEAAMDPQNARRPTILNRNAATIFRAETMLESAIKDTCKILPRMPEHCRPGIYHKEVRRWIQGVNHAYFEGISPKMWKSVPGVVVHPDGSVSFIGETGAQSSLFPAILAWLCYVHKASILVTHLQKMRAYMPPEHRAFIENIEKKNAEYCAKNSQFCERVFKKTGRRIHGVIEGFAYRYRDRLPHIARAYDACIKLAIEFLTLHIVYTHVYIQKWGEGPLGTGGTPYWEFLGQHIEEFKTYFIGPPPPMDDVEKVLKKFFGESLTQVQDK